MAARKNWGAQTGRVGASPCASYRSPIGFILPKSRVECRRSSYNQKLFLHRPGCRPGSSWSSQPSRHRGRRTRL